MRHILHDDIYQDRKTERALCYDFPADKNLISGLHSLQAYFLTHGSHIEIPVVRIMNTAHRLVSYMYATTCSGDQNEYDAMTYNSVGRDKQLMFISLIVLAAMLKRTEGQRAKTCRSIVMEDRSEDFYEGVSLYEQWLSGGSEHYSDEDFQIDLMDELNEYKAQLNAAQNQIYQLQKQLKMKEEKQPITNIYNNYGTISQCNIYAAEQAKVGERVKGWNGDASLNGANGEMVKGCNGEMVNEVFCRITKQAIDTGHAQEVEDELRSACVSAPKLVKAIRTNEALGYLDTQNLSSQALYDMLNEHFGLAFKYRQFVGERSK